MRAGHSNLYVDAQGGVAHNGENVQQFTYNGSAAQLWRLIDAGNGAVYIETKMKPGLSFDCANRQGSNGTNVQLWERGNVDWNKWKLTPVDAPPPPTVYPKDGWYRICLLYTSGSNVPVGDYDISQYEKKVQALAEKYDLYNKVNGAVVMNCNPFTKGHRYLIECARKYVDHLLVFVVEEDKSYYAFKDRKKMVELGTKDLENVIVLALSLIHI